MIKKAISSHWLNNKDKKIRTKVGFKKNKNWNFSDWHIEKRLKKAISSHRLNLKDKKEGLKPDSKKNKNRLYLANRKHHNVPWIKNMDWSHSTIKTNKEEKITYRPILKSNKKSRKKMPWID